MLNALCSFYSLKKNCVLQNYVSYLPLLYNKIGNISANSISICQPGLYLNPDRLLIFKKFTQDVYQDPQSGLNLVKLMILSLSFFCTFTNDCVQISALCCNCFCLLFTTRLSLKKNSYFLLGISYNVQNAQMYIQIFRSFCAKLTQQLKY